jgi:hypothetical protein
MTAYPGLGLLVVGTPSWIRVLLVAASSTLAPTIGVLLPWSTTS